MSEHNLIACVSPILLNREFRVKRATGLKPCVTHLFVIRKYPTMEHRLNTVKLMEKIKNRGISLLQINNKDFTSHGDVS